MATVAVVDFLVFIAAVNNVTAIELDSNYTSVILNCFTVPESVIAQYVSDLQVYWRRDGDTVDNTTEVHTSYFAYTSKCS